MLLSMFTFFLMIAFWWKWPCGGERRIRFGLNLVKTNWEIFDLSAEIPWRRPDRNNIGCFRTQTHTHKDSPKQTDTDPKKLLSPTLHCPNSGLTPRTQPDTLGPFFRTYLRKFVCGVNFWAISAPGKFGLQKETSFSRFVSGGLP